MLSLLKIQNLALVEDLAWELDDGLIGVTGETGAGKSIIVGALKLILGERADRGLIRAGAETCTVEAVFDLKKALSFGLELCASQIVNHPRECSKFLAWPQSGVIHWCLGF